MVTLDAALRPVGPRLDLRRAGGDDLELTLDGVTMATVAAGEVALATTDKRDLRQLCDALDFVLGYVCPLFFWHPAISAGCAGLQGIQNALTGMGYC